MKYKNIKSVAHNLGHSFLSDTNFVSDDQSPYRIVPAVLFATAERARAGEVTIDFLASRVTPEAVGVPDVVAGVAHYCEYLRTLCASQNVEFTRLTSVTLRLDFDYLRRRRQREYPHAEVQEFTCTVSIVDDRGVTHEAHPNHWWLA